MKDPSLISDDQIQGLPNNVGIPAEARSTGWVVPISPVEETGLVISLSEPSAEVDPIYVDSVNVNGNVKSYSVHYKLNEADSAWTAVHDDLGTPVVSDKKSCLDRT